MANRPPQPPVSIPPRTSRRRHNPPQPWAWLLLSLVIYAIAGLLLTVFSPPLWVWPIALLGTLLQALALSGPLALQQLSKARARWSILLGLLGSGGLVVALAIAAGYAGTDDIDAIRLLPTALQVILVNLGVLLLTAICTMVGASAGDQLLSVFNRLRAKLLLAGACFLGLFLGGMVGVALTA